MKPLVIIHGWSDKDDSFVPLADAVYNSSKNNRPVEQIWLGDYVSLDDDVQMKDLVRGLTMAWEKRDLPTKPKGTDVILHSTGGLIIRDWIASEYVDKGKKPPIENLVMLAPANFGSPLAHKGRAFYGRVVKGFTSKKSFETGTQILKALEMASPYTWELAKRDRFGKNVFTPNGVRTTVIVGNTGYRGISSIANEAGSDGTVYVSTANLNCNYLFIDFYSRPKKPKAKSIKSSKGQTAFLVLDGHNHSSVALKEEKHKKNKDLLKNILKSIDISSKAEFEDWIKTCTTYTDKVLTLYEKKRDNYKHGYQNTVIRVTDDQGFDVTDYVVEFYQDAEKGLIDRFSELFNDKVVSKVHIYKGNPAYRSFMINCTELYKIIDKKNEYLRISLSAMPDINEEKNMVGYRTFEDGDIDYIQLDHDQLKKYFVPNRTLFVDIKLTREQKDRLFRLNRVEDVR